MLAHYDQNTGEIRGFYHPDIHVDVPTPTVELTEAQWSDIVNGTARKSVDTETGALVDYKPPQKSAAEILAARTALAKAECRRRIYAVASAEAQANMAASAATHAATSTATESAEILAGVEAWNTWRDTMRATWPGLAEDTSAEIAADASWPECPAAVIAFVGQF